jgi:hypothetical protein
MRRLVPNRRQDRRLRLVLQGKRHKLTTRAATSCSSIIFDNTPPFSRYGLHWSPQASCKSGPARAGTSFTGRAWKDLCKDKAPLCHHCPVAMGCDYTAQYDRGQFAPRPDGIAKSATRSARCPRCNGSILLLSPPRCRSDAGLRLSLPAGPSLHHAWPRLRPLVACSLNASRECSRADLVQAP